MLDIIATALLLDTAIYIYAFKRLKHSQQGAHTELHQNEGIYN